MGILRLKAVKVNSNCRQLANKQKVVNAVLQYDSHKSVKLNRKEEGRKKSVA